MKYQTICFDYDGTLHDSMQIYFPAFVRAYDYLAEHGYQPKKIWKKKKLNAF